MKMVGLRPKHDWMFAKTDILFHLLKGIKGKKTCQKIDLLIHVLKGIKRKIKTQKVD